MDPHNATGTSALENGETRSTIALISLLEELENVLARTDAQGLSLAANHISHGIELIRVELDSIQSENA